MICEFESNSTLRSVVRLIYAFKALGFGSRVVGVFYQSIQFDDSDSCTESYSHPCEVFMATREVDEEAL